MQQRRVNNASCDNARIQAACRNGSGYSLSGGHDPGWSGGGGVCRGVVTVVRGTEDLSVQSIEVKREEKHPRITNLRGAFQ